MPPGYTEDQLSEVDPKNEPLKNLSGTQHTYAPVNHGRSLYELLPEDVQNDTATWPAFRGTSIHMNKAKLKVTLIQMFKAVT